MESEHIKTSASGKCYMIDLPYENDLDQEDLNRRLRKPGEPPYDSGKSLPIAMPKGSGEPIQSFFFEAIPVDEAQQDELNRIMRKPGDPPYDPTAKWLDPPKSATVKPDGTAAAKPAKE